MVLKGTFVHTYVGGWKADLPREVGSTSEVKVNATAQNAGFLLKELRQKRAIVFVAASHQTRLDTRSKARRPIKVGIKGRGRSGRSRDSNPACLCCSSAHLVQCEPDEASSFTNPNVGPGTYASLRLKLDAWSSAVQRGQKCSSPTRRLPSRNWGPIRPRVCSWFRAPIRHECQTAQTTSVEKGRLISRKCCDTQLSRVNMEFPHIKWV